MSWPSWANSIFALWTLLLIGGYVIYRIVNEKQKMQYEQEFMNRHHDEINRLQQDNEAEYFIPLTFERRQTEYLLILCGMYRSKWTSLYYKYLSREQLGAYEPSIRIHRIKFRKIATKCRPVRIEMIRCNEMYGLIDVGDGHTAYVLEKAEPEEDNHAVDPVFNICGKFVYKRRNPRVLQMEGLELTAINRDSQISKEN